MRQVLLTACCLGSGAEWNLTDRNLDFLEIFSGQKPVTHSLRHLGYSGISVGVQDDPRRNFAEPGGFLMCARAVLTLKAGGGAILSPSLLYLGVAQQALNSAVSTEPRRRLQSGNLGAYAADPGVLLDCARMYPR
eukprot:196877-Pyramimonas_sp.AAC.1